MLRPERWVSNDPPDLCDDHIDFGLIYLPNSPAARHIQIDQWWIETLGRGREA
jgi:hypothetical protein